MGTTHRWAGKEIEDDEDHRPLRVGDKVKAREHNQHDEWRPGTVLKVPDMHGFHRSGKTPQEIVRQNLFLEAEVMRCRQLKQKEDEDDLVAKKGTQNGDDDDERVLR